MKPRPGPHKKFESIPLLILVRNILKLADTAKDAKKIIKSGEILVDEKKRKDHKHPVGLMDTIQIPKLKKKYRVTTDKKGLTIIEIPEKEVNLKLCRINGKTIIKGGKLQLNLHDGRNIIINEKTKKQSFETGDSVLIKLPEQKIVDHIKMKNGNLGLITAGQNKGEIIKIKAVKKTRSREPNKVSCELKGREFDTIKDYVFVVGEAKPLIKIGD